MTTQILINLSLFQTIALVIVSIWSLVWTMFAAWIAAKKNSKIWFIILLMLNTAGILEILYIFILSKRDSREKTSDSEKLPNLS